MRSIISHDSERITFLVALGRSGQLSVPYAIRKREGAHSRLVLVAERSTRVARQSVGAKPAHDLHVGVNMLAAMENMVPEHNHVDILGN